MKWFYPYWGPLVVKTQTTEAFVNKLLEEGVLTDEKALELDQSAKDEANASAEFASASPFPEPDELMDDIYWETDNPAEKTSSGTMFFETPS